MKGIVLAAGKGTRLYPITLPVCKPLLPVYDKPLIYYSVATLMQAGIKDIMVIVPPGEIESFADLLGDGSSFGINIEYKEQMVQRGIADAFVVGASFIDSDTVCLMLGDNIFFGPAFAEKVRLAADMLKDGATIFGYYVDDPTPFGVVEFDSFGKAKSIEEKPTEPRSNYIVPGLYFYDKNVVEIASNVQPSARGELEITSVNTAYLEKGKLQVVTLGGEYSWFDAGTADNLYEAAGAIRKEQMESGRMIACLEEIAMENGWISEEGVIAAAERLKKTKYGEYLRSLVD